MQSSAKQSETKQHKASKAMQSKAEQSKAMQSKAEHLHLALPLALLFAVKTPYWGRAGFIILHVLLCSVPEGSLRVPGGSFRCPWKCPRALGASLWVRVTSLGMPGGSFGGPRGSWSCSCEALGGHLGTFGRLLGVLGRSWGGPWATLWETKCSRRYAHRCFSVSHVFHIFLPTF